MLDLEDAAVAAPQTIDDDPLARWQAGFDDLFGQVAGRFAQVQSRRRARLYLLGLLSGAERKNSWTIAEQAGDLSPDGMRAFVGGTFRSGLMADTVPSGVNVHYFLGRTRALT